MKKIHNGMIYLKIFINKLEDPLMAVITAKG